MLGMARKGKWDGFRLLRSRVTTHFFTSSFSRPQSSLFDTLGRPFKRGALPTRFFAPPVNSHL